MQSPIVTIMTNDLEASRNFYEKILDFKIDCEENFPGVTLLFMHKDHFTLELVARKEKLSLNAGNTFILTLITESFDDIKDKLSKNSIKDYKEITLPSGVQMLRFLDPSGVTISYVKENTLKQK